MERQLSEVERAQVEACKEPGERTTHRVTRQTGIIKQKADHAILVWWGTSDNRPVMTWEKAEDLEPVDTRVWPEKKDVGSPSGHQPIIDLRDPKPKKARGVQKALPAAKAVKAVKAVKATSTKATSTKATSTRTRSNGRRRS